MTKFLVVGDIHVKGANPRNRKDNYLETCLTKVQEVVDIANMYDIPVIQTGDIFDSPVVSYGVLGALAEIIKTTKQPWYCVAGNHDLIAHNISTLPRTGYGVLCSTGIIQNITDTIPFLRGVPFNYTVDKDYSEYKVEFPETKNLKLLVCHTMILPDTPIFERYSLIDNIVTDADIIISGHYHLPFTKSYNGKTFINPGALTRLSATEEEIKRMPKVVLLDCVTGKFDYITLKTAKTGVDVLDREAITENKAREEAMENFLASLSYNSESRFMNLQEIIERVGDDPEIVNKALSKLSEARERRKV